MFMNCKYSQSNSINIENCLKFNYHQLEKEFMVFFVNNIHLYDIYYAIDILLLIFHSYCVALDIVRCNIR